MNIIVAFIFIIMSIINIIACNKKNQIIINLSKITLAPLALMNVLINTHFNSQIITLICITYGFYLIGDILLLSDKLKYFASGLISFLLGHITFIIIFIKFNQSHIIFLIALLVLIYPEILMFKIMKNGNKLKKPMRVYSLFLLLFIAFSITTLNPLFIIGTSFFTLSDSFIARNICSDEKKYSDTQIMGTYTLALIILSFGMIII